MVHMTLAPDLHDLEPTLTRYGYNAKLHNQLLAAGIPLSVNLSPARSA
jgi:hypothetical protein